MLINIKTRHFHSSIIHQKHIFHRTLTTSHFRSVNIVKFLRTATSENTSRSSRLQMFLKVSQTSQERTYVRVSFSEKVAGWSPATLLKKTPTRVFSCKICESFKDTFFTEHPRWLLLHLRWLLLYFLKSNSSRTLTFAPKMCYFDWLEAL